jgi:uroporphyrinogen decarboxylase
MRNDLVIRAALGQKTERVPVWAMRQAGRYLPEFRETRVMADFFKVCRTPELACEVTLQPLRRYPYLDAAIIFSDILVVPQAMGMDVQMVPGRGPVFPEPIRTPEDLKKLTFKPDVDKSLGYVYDAINLTREKMDGMCPLIGFAGAPWSLMVYMIEGGSSPTKSKAKSWLYKHPEESHRLLQAITDVLVEYLLGQVAAGAQMLQVFETVGAAEISQEQYYEFVLPYLQQIARRVKERTPQLLVEGDQQEIPMIVFSKDTHYALPQLTEAGYDVIGLDWKVDRAQVREITTDKVSLQGNLDTAALFASPEVIRTEVAKMLQEFGTQRYIANLGHGLQPTHDPENVGVFFRSVQEISAFMNSQTKE